MKETYSQTPGARKAREYTLAHPEALDRNNEQNRRNYGKRRTKKVLLHAALCSLNKPHLLKQVAWHLSRGRDAGRIAGRIAIWLNTPVSTVQAAVDELSAERRTK